VVLHPTVQAASTIQAYNKTSDGQGPGIEALIAELVEHSQAINRGDLSRAEQMLMAQAHTLDAIFGNLARRAALNVGEHMHAAETYLRLSLKAQSQCRATLETLALIKNPQPVAFVRQQNIGVNQQVNNGSSTGTDLARTRDTEIEQSKLSGGQSELLPDARAQALAGRVDPTMEAVGEVDRAEIAGRQD